MEKRKEKERAVIVFVYFSVEGLSLFYLDLELFIFTHVVVCAVQFNVDHMIAVLYILAMTLLS